MNLGILGLGVMGRSLALNFERNGYSVAGYDIRPGFAPSLFKDKAIKVFDSLAGLVAALDKPRVILIMVPAGKPVDKAIVSINPYLEKDDIVMDGGNSFFVDTQRRNIHLEEDGIRFIGMGVSGGESGALWGPSLMPGGVESAWEQVRPMLESISAKADDGAPCVAWMGKGGAGHYVKMVHNGIEYGDMQLIAEIYDLLHRGAGFSNGELAEIFAEWNQYDLQSYLIEITSKILGRQDEETSQSLVDLILDEAAQKGTGRWTSQNSLEIGALVPTIYAAVEMRLMSSLKSERMIASRLLGGAVPKFEGNRQQLIDRAEKALYASKVTSYAQGFALLRSASREYGFGFNHAAIARIWRAGCIIRASLLDHIAEILNLKFYFVHPYAAWERGVNENTNGLLRQYFPKKSDFQSVSNMEIEQAMARLNFRPRKSLRFKTPFEVFYNLSNSHRKNQDKNPQICGFCLVPRGRFGLPAKGL